MTDVLGFGIEKRREVMGNIATEKVHFRDGFRQMLESISERHTFDEGKTLLKRGGRLWPLTLPRRMVLTCTWLKDIKLDPGFKDFFGKFTTAKPAAVTASQPYTIAQNGQSQRTCQ